MKFVHLLSCACFAAAFLLVGQRTVKYVMESRRIPQVQICDPSAKIWQAGLADAVGSTAIEF